ncbi:hypothetical protein LCGC14_0534550 [marine sediment metagenome]|uniref:Uncharacterized protein n=1 Tax=marine sediment metagenome TaxID=412755 RepID=A0A0F9RZ81_9ZZZZ
MKSKKQIAEDTLDEFYGYGSDEDCYNSDQHGLVNLAISKTKDNERQNFADWLEGILKAYPESIGRSMGADEIKAKIKKLKKPAFS